MPSGAVEQQHRMRALRDMAGYFLDMQLHHLGIHPRERQRRPFALGRADRAEEIGVFVALIGGLTRTRSTSRPLPNEAVLLADARFVLEPDYNGCLRRQ